jgi:hypothetical protein
LLQQCRTRATRPATLSWFAILRPRSEDQNV